MRLSLMNAMVSPLLTVTCTTIFPTSGGGLFAQFARSQHSSETKHWAAKRAAAKATAFFFPRRLSHALNALTRQSWKSEADVSGEKRKIQSD